MVFKFIFNIVRLHTTWQSTQRDLFSYPGLPVHSFFFIILEFMKNSPTCQYYFAITPTIMPLNFLLKIMYHYACYKLKYIWGFKDFDRFGIHMSDWTFNYISNHWYGACILTFAKHKDNHKTSYLGHNKWLLESMHIFLISF